jgi:hypothetical protein
VALPLRRLRWLQALLALWLWWLIASACADSTQTTEFRLGEITESPRGALAGLRYLLPCN